ncbi:MAG: hypothetical protein ACLFTR_03420 [Candidatus Woesearchaeota archaeon]
MIIDMIKKKGGWRKAPNKKGMTEGLTMLPKIALVLLVTGLIIAVSMQLNTDQREQVRSDLIQSYMDQNMTEEEAEAEADDSDALDAIDTSQEAMVEVSDRQLLIVGIILAVLLISVVLIYLWPLIQERLGA